jgi:hypothetical protein
MKPLLLALTSLILSSGISPIDVGKAAATPGSPTHYLLRDLSLPRGASSATARAINRNGIVVGNAVVNSSANSEIWQLGAKGTEKERKDIAAPKGYANSEFVAINDSDVAVGTVYAAPGSSGLALGYPAYYHANSWTILRWGGSVAGKGEAIASNGVISASLWNAKIHNFAAATITPTEQGIYPGYKFLPLDAGDRGSDGGSIVSIGRKTVVGGYVNAPASDDQVTPQAVIWVNRKGPFTVNTSRLGFNQPGTGITSIYGSRLSEIYAVGFGYESVGGVSWTEPWVVHINAAAERPIIGTPVALPLPAYASFGSADTIGESAGGNHNELTIGGNVSDFAGATSAALWNINTSGGKISGTSFTDFSTLTSTTETNCPVYAVDGMNAQGNAAGYAFCNGEVRPATIYATAPGH